MFHTQGRLFTGFLFQKFFSSISKIDQIKFLRWFSFAGWMITVFIWAVIFKKWVQSLDLASELWSLSVVYIICCVSVCIYIGWASCMEVFLATLFGLLSSHILFINLIHQEKEIHLSGYVILGSIIFGVLSLFVYQPAFGIFILPFLLRYIEQKKSKPDSKVIIGVVFYLVIYLAYFLWFRYSLRSYNAAASTRAELHFNLLKKISFFFSGPFPQGFSMNLLFYAGSIFSQIFYVAVFLIWLITIFKRNQKNTVIQNIYIVGFILLMLALIYLPSMVAIENFSSYRTLFAFNLSVFIIVIEGVLATLQNVRTKTIFLAAGFIWLLLTGFYAFNFQYIIPLQKEYYVLGAYFQKKYNPTIDSIYFIRADKSLFSHEFHAKVYRDEFGAPSTYRDWVPEPIVKQMIYEKTRSRTVAEKTAVIQFENRNSFDSAKITLNPRKLIINMDSLFEYTDKLYLMSTRK